MATEDMTVQEVEKIVGENAHIKGYKQYCRVYNRPYDPNFRYGNLPALFKRVIQLEVLRETFADVISGKTLWDV